MNPEVRFRVPSQIYDLAQEESERMGLETGKGRSTGVSKLARGAFYAALKLPLPRELRGLKLFAKAAEVPEGMHITVTVHHRVSSRYRRAQAIENGVRIPLRATTVLRFAPGELPDFLEELVEVPEDGLPQAELNLEGDLSPRPELLGELISESHEATLEELERALAESEQRRQEREQRRRQRDQQQQHGTEELAQWARQHGSPLLQARLEEGFEWLDLAHWEYAQALLAELGVEDYERVQGLTALGGSPTPQLQLQPSTEPSLASIQALRHWRQKVGDRADVQLVIGQRKQQSFEALLISLKTPLPGRIRVLTAHNPEGE